MSKNVCNACFMHVMLAIGRVIELVIRADGRVHAWLVVIIVWFLIVQTTKKRKLFFLGCGGWGGGGGGGRFGYQRQSNSIVEGIYSTDSVYKTFEGFPKIKEKYLPAKYTHSCTRVLHNI